MESCPCLLRGILTETIDFLRLFRSKGNEKCHTLKLQGWKQNLFTNTYIKYAFIRWQGETKKPQFKTK